VLWAFLRVILSADSADRRLKECSKSFVAAKRRLADGLMSVGSVVEPKVIRAVTVRDLCLFIRGIRLLNLY
jgi:hypothetical protein